VEAAELGKGPLTLAEVEKQIIMQTLRETGSVEGAAKSLGMAKTTLYRRLREYVAEDKARAREAEDEASHG
jgi:DNA-binding NtrC family response regulator